MIAAMTIEGLLATDAPFAADLQALRPQPGQAVSAANLRTMLAGSPIVASHATPDDTRVQDAYSIRCTPSVHGAVRDTLAHCRGVAENELAAAIDNPMVLPDGRVESCGNFHGAPLGFAADFLAIAVAEIGAIAERRMDRMLDQTRSHGLPPFLADEVGVDSGMMIGHYTAAAMASENKRLAAPASVDSLPTSGMQEDHVSMAWLAVRKLRNGRRQRAPDPRRRVRVRGAGDRPARPARSVGRDRRPARAAAPRRAGPGPRPLPRPGTRRGRSGAHVDGHVSRAERRRNQDALKAPHLPDCSPESLEHLPLPSQQFSDLVAGALIQPPCRPIRIVDVEPRFELSPQRPASPPMPSSIAEPKPRARIAGLTVI